MHTAFGDRVALRASDLAYHLYQAGAAADPDQTVKMLTLAAEQALVGAAFAEALAHCDRAATIEDVATRALTAHLLRVRGAALKGLGRWPEARATLAQALDALYAAADTVAAARVAFDLALLTVWDGDNQGAHELCATALGRLPEGSSAERVRLLALDALAIALVNDSGYATGLRGFADARSMAAALNDDSLVGLTYYLETGFQWDYGRVEMTIAAADEAIRRLASPADVQWRIDAAAFRTGALTLAGRFAEVDAVIGDLLRVAQEVGHAGAVFTGALYHSLASVHRSGDLVGLEARAREVVARGETVLGPYAPLALPSLAMSLAERGDREGALANTTRGRRAFPLADPWTGWIDGCELWCMAVLDRPEWSLRYTECEHLLPTPGNSTFIGRRWFALFLVLAHVARGELEAAAALYPVVRQILDDGWRVGPLQPVEGLVGLAAAAGGNWDAAEGHFRSALAFVDQIGDRLGKPSVQKWYAWMLLRRHGPGDREQARGLLDQAIPAFRSMGMTLSLGQADDIRRALDG